MNRKLLLFGTLVLLLSTISVSAQSPSDLGVEFEKAIYSSQLKDGDTFTWEVKQASGIPSDYSVGVATGDKITADVVGNKREFTPAESSQISDTFAFKLKGEAVNTTSQDAFLALNTFIVPVSYVVNGTTLSMAQVFENADLTAAADFGGAFNVTTSGDLLTMNVSLVTFGELIYTWNINTGVLQTWYFHISVANLYEGTLRIEQVSSDGNDGGNLFDNAPLPIYSVLIGLLAVPVIRKKFKA